MPWALSILRTIVTDYNDVIVYCDGGPAVVIGYGYPEKV